MAPAPQRNGVVLVIEDDPDVRETIGDFLESAGWRVVLTGDGSEALQQLDTIPRPCLILLDWLMHPMGGEEFIRCLQARADTNEFKVVVMTGDSRAPTATVAPVIGVVHKPFDIEQVVPLLEEHC